LIQHEYGLTRDEFLDHAPFEISNMIIAIVDRKSGYKVSEVNEVSTFDKAQEEKIRRAKEFRLAQNRK
jgi:hypothetical protein